MKKLAAVGIFFFIVLIVLYISPEVTTANSDAKVILNAATECSSMIMMSVLISWGAVLITISILATMGVTAWRQLNTFNMALMISPVVRIVFAIVLLNFFGEIIKAINTNLAAETNTIARLFWGIIPMAVYLLIIFVCGGWDAFQAWRGSRKNKKGTEALQPGAQI